MDREGEGLPSPNLKTQCRENASQLHLFLLFALLKFRIIPKLCRVRAPLFNNQQSVSLDRLCSIPSYDGTFHKVHIFLSLFLPQQRSAVFPALICLCFLNTNMRHCSPQQVYIAKSSPAALPGPQNQPIALHVVLGSANGRTRLVDSGYVPLSLAT